MALTLKLVTLERPKWNELSDKWRNISVEFDGQIMTDEISFHDLVELAATNSIDTLEFIEQSYQYFRKDTTHFERNYGFSVDKVLMQFFVDLPLDHPQVSSDPDFFDAVRKLHREVDWTRKWVFFYAERA